MVFNNIKGYVGKLNYLKYCSSNSYFYLPIDPEYWNYNSLLIFKYNFYLHDSLNKHLNLCPPTPTNSGLNPPLIQAAVLQYCSKSLFNAWITVRVFLRGIISNCLWLKSRQVKCKLVYPLAIPASSCSGSERRLIWFRGTPADALDHHTSLKYHPVLWKLLQLV